MRLWLEQLSRKAGECLHLCAECIVQLSEYTCMLSAYMQMQGAIVHVCAGR